MPFLLYSIKLRLFLQWFLLYVYLYIIFVFFFLRDIAKNWKWKNWNWLKTTYDSWFSFAFALYKIYRNVFFQLRFCCCCCCCCLFFLFLGFYLCFYKFILISWTEISPASTVLCSFLFFFSLCLFNMWCCWMAIEWLFKNLNRKLRYTCNVSAILFSDFPIYNLGFHRKKMWTKKENSLIEMVCTQHPELYLQELRSM